MLRVPKAVRQVLMREFREATAHRRNPLEVQELWNLALGELVTTTERHSRAAPIFRRTPALYRAAQHDLAHNLPTVKIEVMREPNGPGVANKRWKYSFRQTEGCDNSTRLTRGVAVAVIGGCVRSDEPGHD